MCTKCIDGLELLQMVGIPVWALKGKTWPSHQVASSMAGNAFSGFAVGPLLMGVLAAMQPPVGNMSEDIEWVEDLSAALSL